MDGFRFATAIRERRDGPFKEGWGSILVGSSQNRAHHISKAGDTLYRECDGTLFPAYLKNGQLNMADEGNFPRCRHCARIVGE
jgi:hypothetical protein